jgi:formylglycine-generating enzyme required for sulfatase activity
MVVVPAGSFVIGVPPGEEEREGLSEQARGLSVPQTAISVNAAFALGRSHVTRGEFAAFVGASNYQSAAGCFTFGANRVPQWQRDAAASWSAPGFAQTDRDPVVCVSWDDAQVYARWLSQQTGHTYRLPSEAEWEYAARAGTTTVRFWGDAPEEVCAYANVADLTKVEQNNWSREGVAACRTGQPTTAPVASFRPNPFGLYDMLGNAWEWVEDCWNPSYAGRPTDQSAWLSGDCSRRVARGGAWNFRPRDVRAGARYRIPAAFRNGNVGFRMARALAP